MQILTDESYQKTYLKKIPNEYYDTYFSKHSNVSNFNLSDTLMHTLNINQSTVHI